MSGISRFISKFDLEDVLSDTSRVHSISDLAERLMVLKFLPPGEQDNPAVARLLEEGIAVSVLMAVDADMPIPEMSWGYGITRGSTPRDRENAAAAVLSGLQALITLAGMGPEERLKIKDRDVLAKVNSVRHTVMCSGVRGPGELDRYLSRLNRIFSGEMPEAVKMLEVYLEAVRKIIDGYGEKSPDEDGRGQHWIAAGPWVQHMPDGSAEVVSFVAEQSSRTVNMIAASVSSAGEVNIGLYEGSGGAGLTETFHDRSVSAPAISTEEKKVLGTAGEAAGAVSGRREDDLFPDRGGV